MLRRRSSSFPACLIVLVAWNAFAHRPYDRPAGAFKRTDGTEVAILRHYVDGIFFADPVSVQFRLANGTNIIQTGYSSDAVVRVARAGIEVYEFPNTWIPIAARVSRFDGYALKDITSERRSVSPLVHIVGHWVAYCVVVLVIALFVLFFLALRAMPKRGWRMGLRSVGFALFGLAAFLCAYDILVFEPVSPPVLGGVCLTFILAVVFFRRRSHELVG
jgi:hypothetical protein